MGRLDEAASGAATFPRLPRSVLAWTLALYVASVAACALTRDFGFYFDDKFYVESLRVTFDTGVLLPERYRYPSLGYFLSLLAALPSWAAAGFDREVLATQLAQAQAQGLIPAPRLALDARILFAAVSYLALFWVALLAWRVSLSKWGAIAAATALALSFEFHYHARQWAPDSPMAQFACLAVLLAHAYTHSGSKRMWIAAAIASGLAAGTKYPGALALAALGAAIAQVEFRKPIPRARAVLRAFSMGLGALAILVLVLLITTPGAIFDSDHLWKDIRIELRHYRGEGMAGPHRPFDVEAGGDHLGRILAYLAAQSLSYRALGAAVLFAVACVGAAWMLRARRAAAWIVLSLPIGYVAYFSSQKLMSVRNLEVLLPSLAVLFGLGVGALIDARRLRPAAWLLCALAAVASLDALRFLAKADATILGRRDFDSVAAMRDFVEGHDGALFLAPSARSALASDSARWIEQGRIVEDAAKAREALLTSEDFFALLARPDLSLDRVRANWPAIYRPLPQGPFEVNLSYYPTWAGDPRPMVVDAEYYRVLAGLP